MRTVSISLYGRDQSRERRLAEVPRRACRVDYRRQHPAAYDTAINHHVWFNGVAFASIQFQNTNNIADSAQFLAYRRPDRSEAR
jgi:hypothetical protein